MENCVRVRMCDGKEQKAEERKDGKNKNPLPQKTTEDEIYRSIPCYHLYLLTPRGGEPRRVTAVL